MDWLKAFGEDTSADPMPATDQVMWFRLLLLDNSLMWREWFGCSDRRLQTLTGINSCHAITVAKNRLKQRGWLDFKAGTKKTTLYKITLPDYITNGADVGADVGALNRQDKTRLDKTKKKIQKEKPLDSLVTEYTQNPDLIDALRGFVEMRKRNKKPLTERALKLALKELDKLGSTDEEKIAIADKAVERGWLGFYALNKQEVRQSGAHISHSKDALDERYPDFAEANRNYVPPWEVRPAGGGDRAASGGDC